MIFQRARSTTKQFMSWIRWRSPERSWSGSPGRENRPGFGSAPVWLVVMAHLLVVIGWETSWPETMVSVHEIWSFPAPNISQLNQHRAARAKGWISQVTYHRCIWLYLEMKFKIQLDLRIIHYRQWVIPISVGKLSEIPNFRRGKIAGLEGHFSPETATRNWRWGALGWQATLDHREGTLMNYTIAMENNHVNG